VKFSRDGRYLAAGCGDGKAYIYDVETGKLTRRGFVRFPWILSDVSMQCPQKFACH